MGLDQKMIAVLTVAAILRFTIFLAFPDIPDFLTSQVEISTPVSSFKRLQEGLFLYSRGASPYDGGVFHQAPLLLAIFDIIPAPLIYTGLDVLNAISLYLIAQRLTIPSPRFRKLNPSYIAAAYIFNPFTLLSCLGRTTNIFANTAIVQATLCAVSGNGFQSMFALAAGAYFSLYPALLLPPMILLYHQSTTTSKISIPMLLTYCVGIWSILLLTTPIFTTNFWEFLRSCYGAQITFTDLTPNIGLWWYFFIEIFDAFRDFFIGVFWLHLMSYVGGLTFRLPNQPFFVITSLLGLFAIFKPYPSVSDVSLYLAFLPMYQHVLPCKSYSISTASTLTFSSNKIFVYRSISTFVLIIARTSILLPMDLCWFR